MKKGRFGLVLCFYPIAAFLCAVLRLPLLCFLLAGAAIFVERDEWTGRQTLQAFFLSLLAAFFTELVPWGAALIDIPVLSSVLGVVATVLNVVFYLLVVILSVFGIIRVSKDQETDLPLLADLAYLLYGKKKPRPAGQFYPPQQPPYPQQPTPPADGNNGPKAP